MKNNIIEIYQTGVADCPHKVLFINRIGKKVYCYPEQIYQHLNTQQQDALFSGSYVFAVNHTTIKAFENMTNFPA